VQLIPLATGLAYPECPRWHEGELWLSDQHAGEVLRIALDGTVTVVEKIAGRPSGLGWLPDGSLLIVSMLDRRLLQLDGEELIVRADFRHLHPGPSNDMVVDSSGRAYVGNIGFDFYAGESMRPTVLTMVDTDGTVKIVAEDVVVPNGMAITPDNRLILAESWRHQLTVFEIASDGGLQNRATFAELGADIPDGMCLDAEGAVWYASLHDRFEVVRVAPGGAVLDRVSTGAREPIACTLGGPRGTTLFVCTSEHLRPEETTQARSGAIETIEVAVPRAGLP
jgi:sugar lactone lactonase YvrE